MSLLDGITNPGRDFLLGYLLTDNPEKMREAIEAMRENEDRFGVIGYYTGGEGQ